MCYNKIENSIGGICMMQYTSREIKRNKKKYNKMSQEEKWQMSHDFEMLNKARDMMDISTLNIAASRQYINAGNMYAGLGYKGQFLEELDALKAADACKKYVLETGFGFESLPAEARYREYLEDNTTFDGKRSNDIQVKKICVNPEKDLSVDMHKGKVYKFSWSDSKEEQERKFGKEVPKECRLFDENDPIMVRPYQPAIGYKIPVLGGNKFDKIKFTTCVKSSRLGKLFGFAAKDQQSAISLEYTDWVDHLRNEKFCNRVKIAVSMKKDRLGRIHYDTPMYGEYDGPDSEKTETEVTPNTAYGILANMSKYMRANPEGSFRPFKNNYDFVRSVTGRSYETARNGEDRTNLKNVAELHNSYNAGSAANKIRNWKLNLAKEQREKN